MITIKVDTKACQAMLTKAAKQLPFAYATAINATAKDAAAAANASMSSVFNRASSFTQRGVYVPTLATKASLTATVGIRPIQQQYLGLEILGGTRTPAATALVLPGSGPTPLPRGAVKRFAAQAQADQARRAAVQAGQRKRGKTTSANYGVFQLSGHGIRPGDVGGYFQRLPGHKVKRLIAFEPSATYRPKFNFVRQVTQTVNSTFAANFQRALTRALETAK